MGLRWLGHRLTIVKYCTLFWVNFCHCFNHAFTEGKEKQSTSICFFNQCTEHDCMDILILTLLAQMHRCEVFMGNRVPLNSL